MTDATDKESELASKAYADAVADASSLETKAKTVEAKPAPVTAEVTGKPAAKADPAPVTKAAPQAKPAAKIAAPAKASPAVIAPKTPVAKKAPKKKAPVKKPVAAKTISKKPTAKPAVTQKEDIMAKSPDYNSMISNVMSEAQVKAKEAYEKSTEMASELTEFSKGNVEALVETGKIVSTGMQDLSKTAVEEAKGAFETITADMKEMAAVKSPTELFQLQSKLMRRNFESMIALSTKSSEGMIKLANEVVAPISSRMTMAAEKMSKVA